MNIKEEKSKKPRQEEGENHSHIHMCLYVHVYIASSVIDIYVEHDDRSHFHFFSILY